MFRRIFARRSIKHKETTEISNVQESSTTDSITDTLCETTFDDLSFFVDYIGSDYISEAQSIPLLLETLKRIKKQHTKTMRADLSLKGGIFKVKDIKEQGALLITAPMYAIALCAQEYLRGFETTFALNITRRRIHMCHVFKAKSRLEGRTIVRAVALSCRRFTKEIKEKTCDRDRSGSSEGPKVGSSGGGGGGSGGKIGDWCLKDDTGRGVSKYIKDHSGLATGSHSLFTIDSEENLDQIKSLDEEKPKDPLLSPPHPDGSIDELLSEDNTSEKKTDEEDYLEKCYEPAFSELFSKAILAIKNHDVKTLQKCLHDGLPPDFTDESSTTLLHCAVDERKLDIVEFLLEKGRADVDIEGKKEQTPLHLAASQGNAAITKVLLAHGANVKKTDTRYRTPLHLCAGCLQSLEVSYILVEYGAHIEANDIVGTRPVDLHFELYEMQNRLIQSACENLANADLTRSRSNSGCSSNSGSFKSSTRSPSVGRRSRRLFRSHSMRLRPSTSLHSIPDVRDDNSKSRVKLQNQVVDREIASDNGVSGYSTGGSSMKEDSNTDSDLEKDHRETMFSDDYVCPQELDDIPLKHMRGLMDHKSFHHGKYGSSHSYPTYKKDPATDALRLLETLSFNVECQSSILANLCLPKASGQIVSLAHMESSTIANLQQISTLLKNLFTLAGPSGRQKCITAGLLKTVIDLLDSAEPVQATCLNILNDLLQAENDKEYSGTITGIPIEPLLSIIKSNDTTTTTSTTTTGPTTTQCETTTDAIDSKGKFRPLKSTDSGYIAVEGREHTNVVRKRQHEDARSYTWSRNKSKVEQFSSPGMYESVGRGRSKSFGGLPDCRDNNVNSRTPNNGGGGSVGGVANDSDSTVKDSSSSHLPKHRRCSRGSSSSVEVHAGKNHNTNVVAKHVAMKMLTASSRNFKLQDELAKPQILGLLLDCLNGTDEQIVLQATATLANIAMNIETHLQIQVENVESGLLKLLKHANPRIRYHAARGLVYMGSEDVDDIYIYDFLPDEDSSPSIIYVESDIRTYIRGCTIENLVLTLTKDIYLLWDGSTTSSGKERKESSRSGSKSRGKNVPSEYQITNFILSTLQTFVHPVIFMRLLLHRFRDPEAYRLFLNVDDVECEVPHMEHFAPLPVLHARLMRMWITWIENYPNDFITFPIIKTELEKLLAPMKAIDGPYAPCAQMLETLMGKLCEASVSHSLYHVEFEGHHNHLYEQCQKAIRDGRLPCSEEDFVYLAGLQLYIEDLCEYGRDFAERLKTIDSINTTRMKVSIGSNIASSKPLSKKIKSVYEIFLHEQPTERNAKHNYVDCCQGMLGYGCTFFKVKQRIPHKGSRKKLYTSRLFGISPKRVLVLDDRSKLCVETFSCKELRRWEPIEDSLTLKTYFKTKLGVEKNIEFQLDNRVTFKEFSNCILTCTMEINYQGYQNVDTMPWSRLAEECGTWGYMALQLHVNNVCRGESDEAASSSATTSPMEGSSRGRSTTTTVFPTAKDGGSGHRLPSISSGSHNVSQSAPVHQVHHPDTMWNASELLSFLNLKGRVKSSGATVLNVSPSNSEATTTGTTPPKDPSLILDKHNLDPLPSCSSSVSSTQMLPLETRKISRSGRNPMGSLAGLAAVPEKTALMEEGNGNGSTEKDSHGSSDTSYPKYENTGKMLTCLCPPDADLPNLNLRDFSAYELLEHPKELARQITLIDHEMFCSINSKDVLLKISLGLIKKWQKGSASPHTVEKIAQRFDQMTNWIVYSIVSERRVLRRAKIFKNFIETAKQCLELRNYNAVMAIVMCALGSPPVRRLTSTKEQIPPESMNSLQKIENLMDSKGNHKKYREALNTSPTPAVPFFGIYMKDLTFISDGNPDYLKGGVINLNKRRKVYELLEEIQRFQKKRYNFQAVPEIKDYLLNKPQVSNEQLDQMSKEIEPAISSRPGSVTPPVTPYRGDSLRKVSNPSNFFRTNNPNGKTTKKMLQHTRTSGNATPV